MRCSLPHYLLPLAIYWNIPQFPSLVEAPIGIAKLSQILRVCVVMIIKTLEQLSSCFVSNLYDDHNHLRVLTHVDKWTRDLHRWQGKETPEDSVRVEYSGARVKWCWSSRTEEHTMEQIPSSAFQIPRLDEVRMKRKKRLRTK